MIARAPIPVLVAAFLLGGVGHAGAQVAITQQLRSLSEIIGRDYEQTYPLVRCAALYQSSIEWVGKDRIGEETFDSYDNSIRNLLAISIVLRSQTSAFDVENAQEITLLDTRTIADLYLERYRANYASTGNAWGTDAMWKDDLQICQTIVEGLQ